jgi:hypothetical protein
MNEIYLLTSVVEEYLVYFDEMRPEDVEDEDDDRE